MLQHMLTKITIVWTGVRFTDLGKERASNISGLRAKHLNFALQICDVAQVNLPAF